MKETGSCKAQRETGCTARTGSQPVSRLKGIGEKTEKLFEKVGVCSLEDLLHYYPRDYDRFEQPRIFGGRSVRKICERTADRDGGNFGYDGKAAACLVSYALS